MYLLELLRFIDKKHIILYAVSSVEIRISPDNFVLACMCMCIVERVIYLFSKERRNIRENFRKISKFQLATRYFFAISCVRVNFFVFPETLLPLLCNFPCTYGLFVWYAHRVYGVLIINYLKSFLCDSCDVFLIGFRTEEVL